MSSFQPEPGAVLARNILRLMKSSGLTVDELGDKSGLEVSFVGSLLQQEKEATVEDLLRLAGALGVEPNDLFKAIGPEG